ncbi:MAG: helix-turn-helix domain-containing protein [Methanococcoides sp.]|nr:helix-turn-helix domain-containing protein [Methanococcoides sp.]
MKDKSMKEKILEELIYGPKTTGELAKSLGYEDDEGYGKYNTIRNALNSLYTEGIVDTEKKKVGDGPGRIPTVNSIIESIVVLRKISEEYPGLVTIIRDKPDYNFLEIIFNEHKQLIFDLVEYDVKVGSFKPIKDNVIEHMVEYIGGTFEYHLSKSPNFYHLCLSNDSDALEKKCRFFKDYGGFTDEQTSNSTPYPVATPGAHFTEQPDLIDIAIRTCILFDCFEGYYNEHDAKISPHRHRLTYLYNRFEQTYGDRY